MDLKKLRKREDYKKFKANNPNRTYIVYNGDNSRLCLDCGGEMHYVHGILTCEDCGHLGVYA